MKKWITIDAFIVAFFSAMGYAFGYSVPSMLNVPDWLCLILCIVGGMAMQEIASRIIYSRFTQEKAWRKVLVFSAFVVVFLIGNAISTKRLDESLIGGLGLEWGSVVLFAVLGLVTSLVKRSYKTGKVKKKYGSGEEGFRFNAEEKAYIEGLNVKNAEITGVYDPKLAVKTRTGVYVGTKESGVLSFNGIPYAKAPVGALRWKAPEKLPDSNRVFEAKHFGASAIQVNYEGNPLSAHRQSEDCLTLNVCTTKPASGEKKPVVVYFHGGDFSYGGSADCLWEMSGFVKAHPDIVAVSFNYRLGLLGFIDFSAIPGGEEYPDAENLGLLDQIAALEWVRENIAAFGGDAKQVTVMGDGAGGISIGLLSAAHRAKGLFQKAVVFCGTPNSTEQSGGSSAVLASRLLTASGAANLKELLALTGDRLSELTQELKEYLTGPSRDGKLIPTDVFAALRKGAAKDISFILCTSRDNVSTYSASIGRDFSEKVFADLVEKILKQQTPEAAQKLRKQIDDETQRIGKAKAEADFCNQWLDDASIYYLSESLHAGGSDVRLLYWDVDAVIKNLGVGDVNIVSTILGNSEAAEAYGNVVNEVICEILQTLMIKTVHGEEPALYNNEIQGVSAIQWESYPDILVVSKNRILLQAAEDVLKDALELLRAAGIEE